MDAEEFKCVLSEMVAARGEEVEGLVRQWAEHRSAGKGADLGTLEVQVREWALAIGGTMMRRLMEGIRAGAPRRVPRCGACGKPMEAEGDRAMTIHTSMGDIPFERGYFTCSACPGGSSPLDVELGLDAQHNSPALQRMVSLAGAVAPFEKASDLLGEIGSIPLGRKKVERITEEVGRRVEEWIRRREQRALGGLEKPPEAPQRLYVEADGTTAPMCAPEDNSPQARRKRGQRSAGKVEYKEVKLGALFEGRLDEKGQPEAGEKTYTGTFGNAEVCVTKVLAEAKARGSDEAGEIVLLSDGGGWLWNRLPAAFEGKKVKEILDWCHPSERLGEIARRVFAEDASKGQEWAKHQRDLLYQGRTREVLQAMEDLKPRTQEAREYVAGCVGYFREHEGRMNYGELRAEGYLIGSGVIESACKHIVGERFKRAGMRWSPEHAPPILALRVGRASGWWDCFWKEAPSGVAA